MKRFLLTLASLLALAAHGSALADGGSPSLGRVRSQMNAGTWGGIVLIEARPKAAATAASSAAASAPTLNAAAPVPPSPAAAGAAGPSVFERMRALLGGNEPLSGQRLNDAKHLDSPSQGIALPTASAGAGTASGAATKAR